MFIFIRGDHVKVEKEEVFAGAVGAGIGVVGVGRRVGGANAAAMTGGLAAVGTVVGGGMAAGIIITAATPLVIGAGLFGAVKGIKHIKQKNKNK
ncbi:hypothetical protein COK38_05680 [Bacillus cereus]|uniref:Uncharacterized protein n=2 Tax=Bacillus cereus group TaxID=86661 RepID=A0AA44QDD1_BACCE|nr:hypothetical protein COJ55_21045 [Bacillus cereus]PFS05031.1 hypothetical protein COK38_05680 [Bacillus cereus]